MTQWEHWEKATAYMRGDQKYDLVYENWENLAKRLQVELQAQGELLRVPR